MNHSRLFGIFVLLLFCCLTGCASLPHSAPLPAGVTVKKVASLNGDTPFALSPDGKVLAFSEKESKLLDTTTGSLRNLAPASALALSFAPDGRLAAAFREGGRSSLRVYDAAGKELKRAQVKGVVASVGWVANAEVVVTALEVTRFSFGSSITGLLYRWDLAKDPVAANVHSTTIRPALAALPEATLLKTASLSISPVGDEVAFTMLKDPPLFTPYLQTTIRHLETGAQRVVAELGMQSGGPLYSADGQQILVGNGESASRWVTAAEGKNVSTLALPGRHLAASASGNHLLLDGHLYEKGAEMAAFPLDSAGAFSHDGTALALAHDKTIYLVTGLRDAAPAPLAADKRLLELRRLLSQGLVTQEEFRNEVQKIPAR